MSNVSSIHWMERRFGNQKRKKSIFFPSSLTFIYTVLFCVFFSVVVVVFYSWSQRCTKKSVNLERERKKRPTVRMKRATAKEKWMAEVVFVSFVVSLSDLCVEVRSQYIVRWFCLAFNIDTFYLLDFCSLIDDMGEKGKRVPV